MTGLRAPTNAVLFVLLSGLIVACTKGPGPATPKASASSPQPRLVGPALRIQSASPIAFPKEEETVRLVCMGVFVDDFSGRENATAKVVLTNEKPADHFGRHFKNGPHISMEGSGTNGEPRAMAGELDPAEYIAEDVSTETKWDLSMQPVADRRNEFSTKTHIVLDRISGHLEMSDSYLDPKKPTHNSYSGDCHMENAAEAQAREHAEHASKQAAQEKTMRDNPYLMIAMNMPFKQGRVCDALRTHLIQFAQQPYMSKRNWDDYYNRVIGEAEKVNCLPD